MLVWAVLLALHKSHYLGLPPELPEASVSTVTQKCGDGAGQSETDTRHFAVEGTSFNPSSGVVKGLSALDANLEVRWAGI